MGFVFSYICLLLYRYCAKYVIWIINIGFIIGVFAAGTYFGLKDIKTGLCFFLMGFILLVVLIIYRKTITLVAQIFKESSKALMDVPGIMFEPILVSANIFLKVFESTSILMIVVAISKVISSKIVL